LSILRLSDFESDLRDGRKESRIAVCREDILDHRLPQEDGIEFIRKEFSEFKIIHQKAVEV